MPPNKEPDLRDDMYKTFLELPVKVFMYTIDQVAHMLDVSEQTMKKSMLYFQGREYRPKTREDLMVVNLARVNEKPIWRIPEDELIRWLKFKRINFTTPKKVNTFRVK